MTDARTRRQAEHERRLAGIARITTLTRDPASGQERPDAVRSSLHRAELAADETRSFEATERGIEAFERLLQLAEQRNSGQIRWVAKFLAWVWGVQGIVWHATDIRGLDREIGDDMLAVLDAVRHARLGVDQLAEDAMHRVPAVLRLWGLLPDDEAT